MTRLDAVARRHRATLVVLGAALLVLLAAVCIALLRNNDTSREAVADDRIAVADASPPDDAAVARGRYIAIAGDCVACHATPGSHDSDRLAGGHGIVTPFGTIVASNITPDRGTGIGTWTERDFFKAVRHGQAKRGYLYPAMPYNAYAKVSDRDMHDLWAYIRSRPAVRNSVDDDTLPFPYNVRLLMAGWNLLFFDNHPFSRGSAETGAVARGRYLVDGLAHCGACHTPKNALGGDRSARYLAGSALQGWYAPAITNGRQQGLGSWERAEIVRYLQTGSVRHAVAAGPMAEAVEYSTQHLSATDLFAIASYLKTVPAKDASAPKALGAAEPAMVRGRHLYAVNCSSCHGNQGEGIGGMAPAFSRNSAIRADDPSSMLHVLMVGGRAAQTQGNPTAAGMPSFAWKLDDADMAAVLTYVRNSWGNAAPPITPEQAGKARAALKARAAPSTR